MIASVVALVRLVRVLGRAVADPATRGVVAFAVVTLAVGTVFYARTEGWGVVDSLYFSVITLLTIGYGDLTPTTQLSKLFTVVYALVGVGLLAAFVTALAVHGRRFTVGPRGAGGPEEVGRGDSDAVGSAGSDDP